MRAPLSIFTLCRLLAHAFEQNCVPTRLPFREAPQWPQVE